MAFEARKHVKFLLRCLEKLPQSYASLDTNRLSLAYFCVSGLDVLGAISQVDAARVIGWVYSLQVVPPADGGDGLPAARRGGFRGCGFLGNPYAPGGAASNSEYDGAHLAMTYTALAVLLMLGDDLSRVHAEATLAFVASLQGESGCFCAYPGGESDMRFLFCAAAIAAMLRGGSVPRDVGIDIDHATQARTGFTAGATSHHSTLLPPPTFDHAAASAPSVRATPPALSTRQPPPSVRADRRP